MQDLNKFLILLEEAMENWKPNVVGVHKGKLFLAALVV